jgi:RNA recognition motif-containing protein
MTNIFVGNLKYDVTEDEVREAFAQHGEVSSVAIIKDRQTGQSKGFGFVEMPNKNEAENAIRTLHLHELRGRAMTVNEARPREERGPRGGGGGYGGGGGRGGRRDW